MDLKMKLFFVDTNLFLQCRDVSDLPWNEISDAQHVQLIVPRAVQNEIDKLKADGNKRRAKRARDTNSYFRKVILSDGEQLLVRDHSQMKITITFSSHAPASPEDLSEVVLDSARPDDSILLEVISYRALYPEHDVALLTHDTNPILTAKRLKIPFQLIPDDWLLAPEPDERDKELRLLKVRVGELENNSPKIEFIPSVGTASMPDKIEAAIILCPPLSQDEIHTLVGEIKRAHPMQQEFDLGIKKASLYNPYESALLGFTHKYRPPSTEEIEEYKNVDYPAWLEKLEKKLAELPDYLSKINNRIEISLAVTNIGNVPAEHAIIRIEVSEGFIILPPADKDDDKSTDSWVFPSPPEAPKGRYEENALAALSRVLGVNTFPHPYNDYSRLSAMPSPRDRNGFYYKPHRPISPKTFWEFACEEFRHQDEPEEFLLELSVVTDKKNINGQLKCSVMAKNLPIPAAFEIPLVVSLTERNAMEEARELCGLSSRWLGR
jgi:hypothetical protein